MIKKSETMESANQLGNKEEVSFICKKAWLIIQGAMRQTTRSLVVVWNASQVLTLCPCINWNLLLANENQVVLATLPPLRRGELKLNHLRV